MVWHELWREDAIATLLATDDADVLFVAGCDENQVRFHPQFDHIILLSAPQILVQRLVARTSNSYGKAPGELGRILDDLEVVEPLRGGQPIMRSGQRCWIKYSPSHAAPGHPDDAGT